MKSFRDDVSEYAERTARHLKNVAEEIERKREEMQRKGMQFTALTADQLERKLKRSHSPMIVYQGWSGSAAAGGTISYSIGINNPDPTDWIWLFVHLFVGPANIAPDVSDAVSAVDSRFARLSLPGFDGLTVKAGATEQLDFSLPVPAGIDRTNYLGNSFLFQSTWHDPADYLDRSLFVFEVI
jgi:hypothetical protein